MRALPKIEPCDAQIPESLLRAADNAERRKDDVLNRVLVKLDARSLSDRRPNKGAALGAPIDIHAVAEGKR